MSGTQLVIDYILKGYSNRYINSLLNIEVDRIEFCREELKKHEEYFINENKGVVEHGFK